MLFEPAVRPDREARFGICEDLKDLVLEAVRRRQARAVVGEDLFTEKEKVKVAGRGPRSASRASREQRDTRVRKVVRDESFDDSEITHEIRA